MHVCVYVCTKVSQNNTYYAVRYILMFSVLFLKYQLWHTKLISLLLMGYNLQYKSTLCSLD